jgi:hypothetical protein
MMAIAVKWGLTIWQLDAVSAFTNNILEELVYAFYPDGYKQPGYCLQLIRALYGLRQASRLWYENLVKTLLSLGLTKSSEEPYIFSNDWLIVFFYVDDMAIAFRSEDTDRAQKFKADLMSRYKMTDEGELHWFLGV